MIISHLKASFLYGFITKDEKNRGKTEEILLEFVSIFDTARSLPSVIGDVKMEGFDSTDSHELAFIRPVSYVAQPSHLIQTNLTQSIKCDGYH